MCRQLQSTRRISRPKEEATAEWRKIRYDLLFHLLLQRLIKEDKLGGTCSLCAGDEKCKQNFIWKKEGNKPLGILRADGRIILK
jgi:hypothetical protein